MPAIKVSDIFSEFSSSGLLERMEGADLDIQTFVPAQKADNNTVIFVDKEEYMASISPDVKCCIVTTPQIEERYREQHPNHTFLVTKSVPMAHALIRQRYGDRDYHAEEWRGIHESAIVHGTANIASNVIVGPGAVVGANVSIGQGSVIMARAVVEHDSYIDEDVIVHPGAIVGYGTRIGKRSQIKPGSVIGGEGFGFSQDEKRVSHRIPQRGIVVIEDDVIIGSNCCIDRATYEETRIGRGTKMDNLCHIAHNVKIGEDCLLTAGFIVAGSTTIGDRVIASGQVGILDHLEVASDTVLLHRAGVTENIKQSGMYAGLPIQPLAQYMKNAAVAKKLTELRKKVIDLEKQLKKE
ncbi:MAG: UDP-3-O-(3-hydroxymyristoyl)glucosamine N-acyltransferase [Thioalkalispiraceae bacterium]|jgi:UDP-3-O-[3-hydroxymyristoyl] glucosamine N-acyltransferase